MALRLRQGPVQVALEFRNGVHELTLITQDRPGLFASIAGALTAWGMDILKAAAYSNTSGLVVDTLVFRDRFRNLELNPPERTRFQEVFTRAVSGDLDLRSQIEGRIHAGKVLPIKRLVETRVSVDNDSSSHSTVVEIIAQDRPGLLYRIASWFARVGCNIEIALVDTEGPMAVDVFYVTRNRSKLNEDQQSITTALFEELKAM